LIRLNAKNSLIIVLVGLVTALILYFPKIYLQNNIYYVSKDINKLYAHYISLKEENKFLAQQLEDMKFKNQIEDSLMIYSIEVANDKKNN
jgi:cell division protein FtsL